MKNISFLILRDRSGTVQCVVSKDIDISLETMLNNRVLSLRNEKKNAIFRVQHIITEGFREFLSKNGFIE